MVRNQSTRFYLALNETDGSGVTLINKDPTRLLFTSLPRVIAVDWVRTAGPGDLASLLAKYRSRYSLKLRVSYGEKPPRLQTKTLVGLRYDGQAVSQGIALRV